jgi:hypothetical protein
VNTTNLCLNLKNAVLQKQYTKEAARKRTAS